MPNVQIVDFVSVDSFKANIRAIVKGLFFTSVDEEREKVRRRKMFNQISFFADLQHNNKHVMAIRNLNIKKKYREAYIVVHFPLDLLRLRAIVLCFERIGNIYECSMVVTFKVTI